MARTTNLHKLAIELRNLKHPDYRPFLSGKETDAQLVDSWVGFMAESVTLHKLLTTGIERRLSISGKKIDQAVAESKDAKEFVVKIREVSDAEWLVQTRRAGIKAVKTSR